MGSQLTENDVNFKILLIGESSVGKSSILERFISDGFEIQKCATIGVDFKVKIVPLVNGKQVKLSIWDTAGQERFRTLTPSYYRGTQGAMIVYDVSDRNSFDKIDSWINELSTYADMPQLVKFLVANKVDKLPRVVSRDQGLELAMKHGLMYWETSAKTSDGVRAAFFELVEQIYKRKELWNCANGMKLTDSGSKSKSSCCD